MRVYKQKYKDRNGVYLPSSKWYIELTDHLERRVRIPAFTDKKATQELGSKIEKLIHHRSIGEEPTGELRKFLDGLPKVIRKRLLTLDILNAKQENNYKLLSDHVQDYYQSLINRNNTQDYADITRSRLLSLIKQGNFRYYSDIKGSTLENVLADLRAKGISCSTSNHFLRAMKSFCNWMIRENRASSSPIAQLSLVNEKLDQRITRRELTSEEIERLLLTTLHGKTIAKFTGIQRYMLYVLAIGTGLRAAELASLKPTSFNFISGTITIEAQHEKARRGDKLPLSTEIILTIQEWVESHASEDYLFPGT